MQKCDVSSSDEGFICKTSAETITYSKGDYCYKSNVVYLLLDDATNTSESVNCIPAKEEKYIEASDFGNTLNGVDVSNQLIVLNENAIRIVDPGYYIVGEEGILVDNNDDEEKTVTIYKCTEKECEEVGDLDDNESIIANDGTMFGMDENKKLVKVGKDGIYFFDSNGSVCADEECVISKIVQIKDGVSEVLEMDALDKVPILMKVIVMLSEFTVMRSGRSNQFHVYILKLMVHVRMMI